MRPTVLTLLYVVLPSLLALPGAHAQPAPNPAGVAVVAAASASPGSTPAAAPRARVIVKYKADSPLLAKSALANSLSGPERRAGLAQALGRRVGISLVAGPGIAERTQVVAASGIDSAQLAAQLAAQPDVEYAVPDVRRRALAAPNDPYYVTRGYDRPGSPSSGGPLVGQWYLKPPGAAGTGANTAPSAIDAQSAWDITTGSSGIVVAVLDTGVRFDHEDLQGGNVLPGYDMISNAFIRNEPGVNGRHAGASDPGDWVTDADVNSPANDIGCTAADVMNASTWHGTGTLGLIGAATNNATGMASVGRGVTMLPVRVLGKCGGYDSDIIAGMNWAAGIHVDGVPDNANPARVINLSLGGTGGCNSAYTETVAQLNARGVVVVAAAGNSVGHSVGTPANCAGVIAVAGLRDVGTKVGFSDVGPQIALSAPGGNCVNAASTDPCLYPILTTSNSGTTTPVSNGNGGSIYTDSFRYSVGTSFSAPLVSGTVALMFSVQPSIAPSRITALLQGGARPFPTDGGTSGTPVCVAPHNDASGNPVDQLECYCNTATCGAGMLDSRAAVLAASGEPANDGGGGGGGGGAGGGGGGALGVATLLGLFAALMVLVAVRPRRARSRR